MGIHFTPRQLTFQPGDIIFPEGAPAVAMYLIKRGRVRTVKNRPGGGTIDLDVLGPGGMFGEMAVIDDDHRSASAIAIERTVVVEIPRQLVEDQLRQAGPLVHAIVRVLALRLRATTQARATDRRQTGEVQMDRTTNLRISQAMRQLEKSAQVPAGDGGSA